jgi:hypothetical protein
MLSPQLITNLKRLRDVPISYSNDKHAFVLRCADGSDNTKRGLTRVLREIFPVPLTREDDEDDHVQSTAQVTKKPRKSRNDPPPSRTVWNRCMCRTKSAESCRVATLNNCVAGVDSKFGIAGIGPNYNKRHGMLVDQQLRQMVEIGYAAMKQANVIIDPCVATLRDYLNAQKLSLVASQVPLYSTELDVATAFDIMCTDIGTRKQLHLLEVKATAVGRSDNDRCYVRVRGRLQSSAARGTPLSFYVEHQLQLGVMDHMIRETLGCPPDSSSVIRVSQDCVCTYKLTPWFHEKSKKLLPTIKRRGISKSKVKRKQQEMLTK